MNKKKLILIRGVLFTSSLPLIAASCKNNETKEPKKEPEMDAPIAPPTDSGKDNPEKTDPDQNEKAKVIKTDISKLKLQTNLTNNTTKKDILELLKKQDKLGNLTESDFDFKLYQKALLNREGRIVIKANENSEIIEGQFEIKIKKLKSVVAKEHVYNEDKTEVLKIGYDSKGTIKRFHIKVKKVPAKLPEEVISLKEAFLKNENQTIENIDKWDTSNIEDMSLMFFSAKKFNTDISSWKTNSVKNMSYMFTSAEAFNQNLDKWDTSNVTTMNRMFQEAKAFNGNISNWKTENVSDMAFMFSDATAFNNAISSWNVDNVITMERMFQNASKFNSPIFKLVIPKVKNMQYMFYNAKEFNNSNISDWNTSSVTDIRSMFRGATKFNQNLNWKTENITNMSSLFTDASNFNGDITKWNTGNVVDMSQMFWRAQTFNQDISNWDVKNVKDVTSMFFQAGHFDKSLKNWKFNTEPKHDHFSSGSKLKDLPTFKQPKAK
ncbi:BspA family leucine-rich repeat surface protein [Mycoplasma bovis]|nr:BspA family leucine-rich repeat surface protein [Mycoplasmopsis bovis]